MAGVVDHLVLVRDRAAAIFGHQVLDAAVAARRDLPLELEIEIVEGVDRDDVAAALRILPGGLPMFQPAIFDNPAAIRKRGLLEAAPAFGRLAVEQRSVGGNGLCGKTDDGENRQREGEEATSHSKRSFHVCVTEGLSFGRSPVKERARPANVSHECTTCS